MKRIHGYKYRAYPTKKQEALLARIFGCVRFVYNYFLRYRITKYKEEGISVRYTQTCKELTSLKKELKWLEEPDSSALQQSLKHLDKAYSNFFKKKAKFPKKKARRGEQKYRTVSSSLKIDGNKIFLPKLKWVKIVNTRSFEGRIISATMTKTPSGRYYISLQVEEEYIPISTGKGQLGIDVGIKEFCTTSDGETIENPKYYKKYEKKLKRLHRNLSRKKKDSKNREKARIKLARQYEKMTNVKEDFQHKLTYNMANENQVVCGESLNVKGMLKNHKLAKAISDAAWSKFYNKLNYKLTERGGTLIKVPTNYPSSQTCSNCGYKNPLVKNLSVRRWQCPICGETHDRDINAAKNILQKGLEIYNT